MSAPEAQNEPEDPQAQIARLRQQVETLLRDRVTPAAAALAERAENAAHTASNTIRDEATALAGHVKERPLLSLLIAASAGWILGRAMR